MHPLDQALQDIFFHGAEEPITDEIEEQEVILLAQRGCSDSFVRLLLAYAPALRHARGRYASGPKYQGSQGYEDDVQARLLLAFAEAVQGFDLCKGHNRLAATVTGWLKDAVSRAAQDTMPFAIPDRTLKRYWSIMRAAKGDVKLGAEMAAEYNMTPQTFRAITNAVRGTASLNGDDQDGARMVDRPMKPVWDVPMPDNEPSISPDMLAQLTDLQSRVIRLAYGFGPDGMPMSDQQVANKLGLSRVKVQRTRTAALEQLRARLIEEEAA